MGVKRPRNIFIRPWPTAFQMDGAEHWVIHGPCLLRPELCQATPRLTRYGNTRFTRGTASGRGGPGPQGSRINPVYPYEMPTGSPEVSSFAKLSRLREPQSLRNQPQA